MSTQKHRNKKLKIIKKQKSGKVLSKKQEHRLSLIKSKYIYKYSKEYTLRLKNVKKNFRNKSILKGVTFDIKKGERISLVGKNGAGKSTLINIISQQIRMSEGLIHYGYSKNKINSLEMMGIQFQSLNYPEGFIVKDVIYFFNVSVDKKIRMSNKELSDMISMFGIDKYLDQKIDRLSGGQQQRVNILLALIKKPKLLILDEISTGLDVESAEIIKEYIELYLKKNPQTSLLLISHSDEEIREMTTKTYILENGKIVDEIPSKSLTTKRFLDITSREPKLIKSEIKNLQKESEKNLLVLKNRYNVKLENKLKVLFSNLIQKIYSLFLSMDNSMMDEKNIIEIRDMSKTYGKKVGAVRAFNLNIEEGSRIAITGPNGSGKSTLIEIIAQVKKMDSKFLKYKNLLNLAKADYEFKVKKLEEDINIELRKFKNNYRLEKELAILEIRDLKKNLRNHKIKSLSRKEIEDDIKKLQEKINIGIPKLKEKYNKLEKKLREKLDFDKAKSLTDYHFEVDRIKKEKLEAKKQSKKNSKLLKKYKNLLNLAKADYEFKTKKLKENVDIKLRKFKNNYRLEKEHAILEIKNLKKSLKNHKIKSSSIKEIKNDIKKLQEKINIDILKLKEKYNKLVKKLKEKLDFDKVKSLTDYHFEVDRLKKEKLEAKKQNRHYYSKEFIKNGVEIPAVTKVSKKPKIAYSFTNNFREVKDNCGVQFQYASFPVEMSVLDVILFFARTNKKFMSKDEIINAVKIFKLEKLLKQKAYRLSGGEKQRLNVLLSIMKSPKLLILDEISTGLDVDSIVKIDAFIKDYLDKTNATLILISHNYHEVHSLTNRIIVMKYGYLSEIVDTKGWSLLKVKSKMREIYKGGAI